MDTHANSKDQELLSCEICIKEVPMMSGKALEIDDYVMHFCGLECFDKWHKQAENKKILKELK